MRPNSIIGLVLIIGGLAVLLMGGFSYTKSRRSSTSGRSRRRWRGKSACRCLRSPAGWRWRPAWRCCWSVRRKRSEAWPPARLLPAERLDRVNPHRAQGRRDRRQKPDHD